jgi:hypothetical protein
LPHGFVPLANGDYVIIHLRVKPETLEYHSYGVDIFGPDFNKRLELTSYPVPAEEEEIKTIFVDFPLVAASRTALCLTTMAPTREIEVYDPTGRLIRKIHADYPAVDVPPGFREEILHPLPSEGAPVLEEPGLPEDLPAPPGPHGRSRPALCRRVRAGPGDRRRRLRRVLSGRGPHPQNGPRLSEAPTRPPLRDVVIKDGRLYCVREKPSGFPEVLVFSLRWTME